MAGAKAAAVPVTDETTAAGTAMGADAAAKRPIGTKGRFIGDYPCILSRFVRYLYRWKAGFDSRTVTHPPYRHDWWVTTESRPFRIGIVRQGSRILLIAAATSSSRYGQQIMAIVVWGAVDPDPPVAGAQGAGSFERAEALLAHGERRVALNYLGLYHYALGDYPRAQDYYLQTLLRKQLAGDSAGIAIMQRNLSNLFFDMKDWDRAHSYAQSSYELAHRQGLVLAQAEALGNLAMINEARGQTDAALETYLRTVDLYRQSGNLPRLETQKLISAYPEILGYYGFDVALAGPYNEDHRGFNNNGRVYVYTRDADGLWWPTDTITSPDTEQADYFGYALDMTEDYALIGAYRHQHDANGENPLDEAGAAYLYQRQPDGQWAFLRKFVAPDRDEDNQFGHDVAISDRGLLIGAFAKDVGLILSAGAAYVAYCDDPSCTPADLTRDDLVFLQPSDADNFSGFGEGRGHR